MCQETLMVTNKRGLHARAATKLASTAAQFSSDIKLQCNGQVIDCKSVMSILLLAATKGTYVTISAEGRDDLQALASVVKLFNDKFDEGE